MIGKIGIRNYKSLRNVDIELGKFNVLVGLNASGKSNFLDSLAFLSETSQKSMRDVFTPRGEVERVVFGGYERRIEFHLETVLDEELYSYLISISKDKIEEETLYIDDKTAIEADSNKTIVLRDDGISTTIGWRLHNQFALSVFARSKEYHNGIRKFLDYLSSWRLYHATIPEIRKTLPTRKSFDLEKSGGNLAQVLHSLHNARPKVFSRVEEILKQGIPEIEELLTPPTDDGKTYVAIREKGYEQEFDYYQISDGTLNLLFYITAAAFPEPKLLCFEEPENFVHVRLLQLLVKILKDSEKQIIVSTHSPYLLDFVEPEEVIVVEKEDNATQFARVENAADLKKKLEDLELGLGEYYYSGALGGVP